MSKKGTIIGIISSLLLGVTIPLVVGVVDKFVNPSSSEPTEEYVPLAPEFLEKPTDGSSPKDHSIYDNYRIAGGVLSLTENFRTVQKGNAVSEMVLENNQIVTAERIINDDVAYTTYLTTSSFVNSTNQKLYLEDKVLVREGKVKNGSSEYDNNEPYSYSYDYIYENLGWTPFEMSPYIINEDTIISSKVIENSNYPYSMEFILDNKDSIDHNKREVRYNANALSYPKYEQVKVTISLDNDWRVLEIKTDDIYDITVKLGISMTVPVNSKLVEKFYYDDYQISSLDSYSYFSSYFEIEVDDEEEIIKEKTALDYLLDVAFDVILNGSTFNVKGTALGNEIDGKINIQFDITKLSGNIIGLFDDLYFKYDGDLYLSYLKHDYKFNDEFLNHLLNVGNQGMIETASLISQNEQNEEKDVMGDLINNLTLTKNDNYVTVSGIFEQEEMKLQFDFNFFEIEQGTILRSIVLSGNFEGEEFDITLTTTASKIEYEEKEYNDLSSATWLVDELVEISSYQGYQLQLDYLLDGYDLDLAVNIYDDKILCIFNVEDSNNQNVTIELYYIDEIFYLELEKYIVEVEKENLELLMEYIEEIIKDDNNNSSNETEIVALEETGEQQELLDVLYEVIDEVSMIDDEHMNISLLLSKIDENLPDTDLVLSIENEDLKVNIKDYNIDLFVSEYSSDIVLPVGKQIYNKEVFEVIKTHYSNLKSLYNKDTIQLEINDVILSSENGEINIDGEYTKNGSNYSLELEFTNRVKMKLRVIYLNEKYYLSLGEDSYSINLILNKEQMDTFIEYSDKIMEYILGEQDFDISVEQFISELVDEIMAILSGSSLDMSLGEVLYNLTRILDSSYLEVDKRNVIVEFDETSIQIYKLGENYMMMVEGVEYNDYQIQGDVTLKERTYTISVDSSSFIDISTIFNDLGIEIK